MKEILVLLVLLSAQTTKVCSQPYQVDSDGKCLNSTTEYRLDGSDLCCKKCHPGQRQIQECSKTTETVCEQCPSGQYMESWNYSPNCFSCTKCKTNKGLQEAQSCSSTIRSRCSCRHGMYCIMGFDDPYCTACSKYKPCKVGYGVSGPVTGDSDVRCEPCPNGTFSDTNSFVDPCRPHTNCHGRVLIKKGDATSDTMCKLGALNSNMQPRNLIEETRTEMVFTTASAVMSTVLANSTSKTLSFSPSVSERVFNHSTKSPPASTESDGTLDSLLPAVIAGVIGLLVFIAIILLFLCKTRWKKDAARFNPKVDANGNCESGDTINHNYLGESQLTSFTVRSPEQQCLLLNGEACSDHSQCSNKTETLTRTDGCSSQESIGPLQSTVALHNPHSALSEPMTLISHIEPVTPQPSVSTQSSSQPTSPQVISPVTTNPQYNVNITVHIGNGSCGTQSGTPTDSKLRFGEEEESFSIPQQEAGKQLLMSVQESA